MEGPSRRTEQDGHEDETDPRDKRRLCPDCPCNLGGSVPGAPLSPSAQWSRSLLYVHKVTTPSSVALLFPNRGPGQNVRRWRELR